MVPDFGACVVRTVFRIRGVRGTCCVFRIRIVRGTCCAARPHKTHLTGGRLRAFVQVIAIRILCAVRALRKRRGRQSDRHQRCGNKRFVVHDRCFPGYGCCPSEPCVTRPARDARVIAEFGSPRFGGGLFSRGDNPLSRLGLMRFSKRLTDLIGASGVGCAWRRPAPFRPSPRR